MSEKENHRQISFVKGTILTPEVFKELHGLTHAAENSVILLLDDLASIEGSTIPLIEELLEMHILEESFIFVTSSIDFLHILDEDWPIVPTLREAEDFLTMEDIERKMGLR